MKRKLLPWLVALTCGVVLVASTTEVQAGGPAAHADRIARRQSNSRPWHGAYAHTQTGVPLALVVPPTATMSASWGWGVTATEIRPNYHQFGRYYPGYIDGMGGTYRSTPVWPSHTDQFGVYPVRGPW